MLLNHWNADRFQGDLMLLLIWNDTAVFCFYKFCVTLGVIGFCAGSSSLTAWETALGIFLQASFK